jgi:HAD superfamily hydrolase (TIGR01509 family)
MMEHAVIFDNDGVLIDSEPMHLEADLRTLASYGVQWEPSQLYRFIGVKDVDMWRILREELALPETAETLLARKNKYHDSIFTPERIRPIAGIPELFRALRAGGWKIAVASSSLESLIGPWLEWMGLRHQLDALVTGADVVNSKPHPEPYLLAASRLGLAPAQCVAVEDSPHGIASAKAAGCRCIGFRNRSGPPQDVSGADVVVEDIRDILRLGLLEGLGGGDGK